METVRYGVIGVGNMGSGHVTYLHQGKVKNAELTAVCDIDQTRLDWAKEYHPDVECYSDYNDLLRSGLVDAVIIATPHYLHPIIGIAAFEQGIDVLSEKPVAVYTKMAYEFNRAAEKYGRAFGLMLNQRTEPAYQRMREIVQSGRLGQPKRFVWLITNWYRTQAYYDSGDWRATYAGEGGGVLMNQAPHNLDLWQWIFGMPKRIRAFAASGKFHDIEVEDDVTAYAEYENGATATFITSTGEYPGTNRLEISGSLGKLVYEGGKLTFTKLEEDERKYCFEAEDGYYQIPFEVIDVDTTGYCKAHRQITQNFTDHILKGTPLLAPGSDGVYGLSLANAMMESAWTNDFVELPNDGENYWRLLEKKIGTSKKKRQ
ncbi:MAG: Gfo/Idh/MocA family oxidoreductase [Clostridia bacterium]|nr:Gfo/Idh/MocA family oxidoreductase [Clostridia bacterium]